MESDGRAPLVTFTTPGDYYYPSKPSQLRLVSCARLLGLCGAAATVPSGPVTCSSPFCAAAARSTRTACASDGLVAERLERA